MHQSIYKASGAGVCLTNATQLQKDRALNVTTTLEKIVDWICPEAEPGPGRHHVSPTRPLDLIGNGRLPTTKARKHKLEDMP